VVDGSGLENRHTRKGIGGSNPSLSASKSELQRKSAAGYAKVRETSPHFAILPRQTGLQRTDSAAENGVSVPAFLRRAHAQSGFAVGTWRMECDHKFGDSAIAS
jgi:hypothetical protein